VLSKVAGKILVSFGLIQNFEISDLAMVKVKQSMSQLPTLNFRMRRQMFYPCATAPGLMVKTMPKNKS
jgi:hypothetical protein